MHDAALVQNVVGPGGFTFIFEEDVRGPHVYLKSALMTFCHFFIFVHKNLGFLHFPNTQTLTVLKYDKWNREGLSGPSSGK